MSFYDDFDDDFDDDNDCTFTLGFGIGSDGELNPLNISGDRIGFSFTIPFDQDDEEISVYRCPKCYGRNCEVLNDVTQTHICNDCAHQFIPDEYQPLNTPAEYHSRAEHFFRQRRYDRMIADGTAAIALDPNNRRSYWWRGKGYLENEEFEKAEADFTTALKISPDYDFAYFDRGITRIKMGKYHEGIEDLTTSIGFDPDTPDSFHFRAKAYFQIEEYQKAIQDFTQVIKMQPDLAEANFERGYTFSKMGEDERAIYDYTKAIEKDPIDIDAYFRRAECHMRLGHEKEALWDLLTHVQSPQYIPHKIRQSEHNTVVDGMIKALQEKLGPNADRYVSVFEDSNRLGKAEQFKESAIKKYHEKNHFGAIQDLSKSIDFAPNDASLYQLRHGYLTLLELWDECIQDALQSIRVGNDYSVRNALAGFYLKKGRLKDALDEFTVIINEYLDDEAFTSEASFNRSKINIYLGQYKAALADVSKAISYEQADDDCYGLRAEIFEELGDLKSAISDYQTFVELTRDEELKKHCMDEIERLSESVKEDAGLSEPAMIMNDPKKIRFASIHVVKGSDYSDNNDDDQALKEYALASRILPDMDLPYKLSLMIYFNRGDYENALKNCNQLLRIDPEDAESRANLGACLLKLNKPEKAIAELIKAIQYDPEYSPAYHKIGVIQLMNKEFESALENLNKAIELNPNEATTYLYRADAKEQLGDHAGAIQDQEKYRELLG